MDVALMKGSTSGITGQRKRSLRISVKVEVIILLICTRDTQGPGVVAELKQSWRRDGPVSL